MEAEYVADEREFSGATLDNGMKCVFVRDPKMHNVAVRLDIGGGIEGEPAGLSGLANICLSTVFRGSARYPGVSDLRKFVFDNDIIFQGMASISLSQIAAELPHRAFDGYLDRLSDLVSHPNLSQKGLESVKLRHGWMFHEVMVNVDLKVSLARDYMLWGMIYQSSSLFERTDLLSLLRQYYKRYYCPSNMVIYTMANLSIETMKERMRYYFGKLINEGELFTSNFNPSIDPYFYKTSQVDGHALLAKTYIKSDEKQLSLNFPLPLQMQTSSPLNVSYFFNTSHPGTIQHKLKSGGLVDYIIAEHKTSSRDLQELEIKLKLTKKGSDSVQVILDFIFGYIEILKRMPPSCDYFQQATVYFQCQRRLDSSFVTLGRYSCELRMNSEISDLREAEIPRIFDPTSIRKVLGCLTIPNCFITVISDQYIDAPLLKGSEQFLQLSIENITPRPRFDGLVEPQLDPLIVSSRLPLVINSDLHLICEMPLAFQKSTAGEVYTMLNIGLKSPEFVKLPVSVQRLYATMVNYKMWLETTKDICEVSISVVDNGLNINVKSVPGSLPPLISLLLKYLSSPIGSEHNNRLMACKKEEVKAIRSWLAGNWELTHAPEYENPLHCDIDLKTQFELLENVQSVDDLPIKIEGDLVLIFSGNATKPLSLEVISILTNLQST